MDRKTRFEDLDPEKMIEEMRQEYWRGVTEAEEEVDEDTLQVLVVELGLERFAIDASLCKTITKMGHVTRVPKMPEYVLGVINLRGNIVSVVDMGLLLGIEKKQTAKSRLVVIESGDVRTAFLVDLVVGIELVPVSRLEEDAQTDTTLKDEYTKGHFAPADGEEIWVTYLNMEKIIHGPELTFNK